MRRKIKAGAIGSFSIAVLAVVLTVPHSPIEMPTPDRPHNTTSDDAGGAFEAITVHGTWQIEVRDANGDLVRRREFQNLLTETGQAALANVLGRTTVVLPWFVALSDGENPAHPCVRDAVPVPCLIGEPELPGGTSDWFLTLTVDVVGRELVLNGTATAQADGNISAVTTVIAGDLGVFTGTSISPIPVVEGQNIIVTVTLSFG